MRLNKRRESLRMADDRDTPLVDLVGALARPLAAGAGAVPGGAELVGHLRP